MTSLALVSFLFVTAILVPLPISGQNYEKICRQLYTNCQACQVFKSECVVDNRPKPSQKPDTVPGIPDSPKPIEPEKCFETGKLCDTNENCCSKICKVVKIPLGGPDHYYTQRICRDH